MVIKLCACLFLDLVSHYLQTHTRPFWILYNYQVVLQVWYFCFSIWIYIYSYKHADVSLPKIKKITLQRETQVASSMLSSPARSENVVITRFNTLSFNSNRPQLPSHYLHDFFKGTCCSDTVL